MSLSQPPQGQRPSQTKIVATIGPASTGRTALVDLIVAGVDVFRINTAHGDRQEHQERLSAIREASRTVGSPVGVLVDLPGPKIRLGELPGGEVQCLPDAVLRFVRCPTHAVPNEL